MNIEKFKNNVIWCGLFHIDLKIINTIFNNLIKEGMYVATMFKPKKFLDE